MNTNDDKRVQSVNSIEIYEYRERNNTQEKEIKCINIIKLY